MSRLCPDNDLPVACSVCLQPPAAHSPRLDYVNFEAAYDGPVVKSPELPEGATPVYMEKIVVCERCVRTAARLLGMADAADQDETASWREYAESLESELKKKDDAIADLGYTVGVMLDHPVKRPRRRPQITGPESHEDELKEIRSRRSRQERMKKAVKSG